MLKIALSQLYRELYRECGTKKFFRTVLNFLQTLKILDQKFCKKFFVILTVQIRN